MSALILKGNLSIGQPGDAVGAFVDVSNEVTEFRIDAIVSTVNVPATLGAGEYAKAGGVRYELKISYLPSEAASGLFLMLWTAIGTATKELQFAGSMQDGAISTTNAQWVGSFIVTGAGLGGNAEELMVDSRTFIMTGAPTRDTTP